jgi:hypothetical protein
MAPLIIATVRNQKSKPSLGVLRGSCAIIDNTISSSFLVKEFSFFFGLHTVFADFAVNHLNHFFLYTPCQ